MQRLWVVIPEQSKETTSNYQQYQLSTRYVVCAKITESYIIKITGYLANIHLKQPLFYSSSYDLLVTSRWLSMKTESNRGMSSRMQSMARNDFPLLSHPSPLPLSSQSDKHHKEPMF